MPKRNCVNHAQATQQIQKVIEGSRHLVKQSLADGVHGAPPDIALHASVRHCLAASIVRVVVYPANCLQAGRQAFDAVGPGLRRKFGASRLAYATADHHHAPAWVAVCTSIWSIYGTAPPVVRLRNSGLSTDAHCVAECTVQYPHCQN